jgi:hypothetical protein
MTWIAALILVIVCLLLLLGMGMMRVARRADEAEIEALRALVLEAIYNRLSELESPTGRRFFASPEARQDLEEALADVMPLEVLIERVVDSETDVATAPPTSVRRFGRRRRRFSRAQRPGATAGHR